MIPVWIEDINLLKTKLKKKNQLNKECEIKVSVELATPNFSIGNARIS